MSTNKPYAIECPNCHKTLKSREQFIPGRRIKCPSCDQAFVVSVNDESSDDLAPTESKQATTQTAPDVQSDFSPSLTRFTRLVGKGLILTGVLWIVLPIIFVGGGLLLIPGLRLPIVCFGFSMVLFSVPVLVAGCFLSRHKFIWFVYPGAAIAIIGGLVPLGSLLMSLNAVMNAFRNFPPPDVGSRFGVAMIIAIALVGPLSVLVGVGGLIAAIRSQAVQNERRR